MSVRKRRWRDTSGETREAWLVDYIDASGKRRAKTFRLKKDADAFEVRAKTEVAAGIHTPESVAPTVSEAASAWLADCEAHGLERATVAQYRQHVDIHILPFIGATKLSKLTTPSVLDFRDALMREGRSAALARKVMTSLGSLIGHAKERGRFSGAK